MTAGKTTYNLDLTRDSDKQRFQTLIDDAEVIFQAFRLHSLERKGFGLDDMIELSKKRINGLVYVDLTATVPTAITQNVPASSRSPTRRRGAPTSAAKPSGSKKAPAFCRLSPSRKCWQGPSPSSIFYSLSETARTIGAPTTPFGVVLGRIPEIGLYSAETVAKIQETHKSGPITPDLMVQELLYILLDA